MCAKRLTQAEKHVTGTLAWCRIGVLVWLSFVWVMLMWVIWLLSIERSDGLSERTTYGILHWQVERVLRGPAGTIRRSWIHPVALTFSIVFTVAGTAFIVLYAGRWRRNLTPRWKCQNCGHVVSDGFPQSTVCSECGELPNLQKDPWAFWR